MQGRGRGREEGAGCYGDETGKTEGEPLCWFTRFRLCTHCHRPETDRQTPGTDVTSLHEAGSTYSILRHNVDNPNTIRVRAVFLLEVGRHTHTIHSRLCILGQSGLVGQWMCFNSWEKGHRGYRKCRRESERGETERGTKQVQRQRMQSSQAGRSS